MMKNLLFQRRKRMHSAVPKRPGTSGSKWKLSLMLFVFFFLLQASTALASHFRYGSISWRYVSGNTVEVKYSQATASFGSTMVVGKQASSAYIDMGDGRSLSIPLTITAVNNSEGWYYAEGVATYTYANAGTYTASFTSGNKISGLQNNSNGYWNITTQITTGNNNSGPVLTLPTIVNVPKGSITATFLVPANDPDGDPISFRLANGTELPGIQSNTPGTHPSGITVNSATGLVTFNTSDKNTGELYNTAIVVEDNKGATSMVDFIIKITEPSTPPAFDYAVTPSAGTIYKVAPGQQVQFNIKATDSDAGDVVTLQATGVPAGATINPAFPTLGNPVQASFSWTPTANNKGTNVINFVAQDSKGVQSTSSVVIQVSLAPKFDVPPTPAIGQHNVVAPGTNLTYTVQASDPDADDKVSIVSVEAKKADGTWGPLYSGASFSALPTPAGNSTSGTFSWTPAASDWGHKHVRFVAEDTYGDRTTHEVSQLVNTIPVFTSSPITTATVGQLYVYNITGTDPDVTYGDALKLMSGALPSWLTLTDNGNGTAVLSGTPSPSDAGTANLALTLEDEHHHNGGMAMQNFSIEVKNIPPNEISGTGTNKRATYANATVIDDQIVVTGSENIEGLRVYIESGFQVGDNLSFTSPLPAGVMYSYNAATGALIFTGSASSAEWQSVLRTVQFSTTTSNTANRTFKFILGDLVSLTLNGKSHFYKYITTPFSWTGAKTEAAKHTLFGMSGYLATITSQAEGDFIKNKLQGDGWVGGSDDFSHINAALGTNQFANQASAEGKWYWVTGPEKGTAISTGNVTPVSANGAYMFWNPQEPNNSGNNEHYMQVYAHSGGKWNDLPNTSTLGYVVEFGGYTNDPALNIEYARTFTYFKLATPTVTDVAGKTQGAINDNTPTVKGTAAPNSVVTIYLNTAIVTTVTADADGNWTYTFTPALTDGSYTLEAKAKDSDGFESDKSAPFTFTVDTNAPIAPVFTALSSDNGTDAKDGVTNDATLVLSGTAEANATVAITLAGNTIGTTIADGTGAWSYSYEGTTLPEGMHAFSATATDAAGNTSPASAAYQVTIDQTAPTLTISTTATSPANTAFEIKVEASEAVYTLTKESFTVMNGALSGLVKDGLTYTATVTPAADGEVKVSLAKDLMTDLAGNMNAASNILALTYDATRPTVAVASQSPNPVNAAFGISITFTEDVTGFESADITVANGTVSGFSQIDNRRYTAMVNPTTDGQVTVSLAANVAADAATNGNEASNSLTRLYDAVRPTVALASAAANPVNTAFEVSIVFSEPVSGFTLDDISVSNGTAAQFTKVDDAKYTATITPTADGEVRVAIAANVAADAATNGNEAAESLIRAYDATKPEVTVATTAPNPTNTTIAVTVEFSESVTGFEVSDLSISNGTAADFVAMSVTKYTAIVTPAADGEVTIAVAANVAADAATNGNKASNTIAITYDATAPKGYAVAFDQARVDVTNVSNASVSITGAEVGTTYAYSIQSSNGGTPITGTGTVAAASFQLSNLDLTGLNDGTLTISLQLTDAATNQGAAATAEVIKITRNIVSVATPATMQVPIRTTFGKIGLPTQVEVTYSTGEKETIAVTWQEGNYNGFVAGPYTLAGDLTLAAMTTNIDGHKASITVEVQPNKAPTALALSKNTFKPNTTAADVIGEFATTDADDPAAPLFEEHVYTLVSGQGDADNSLFEIRGKELHLRSNHGLSGQVSFTIRVRSTDPYNNTIEKAFTLQKTAYEVATEDVKIVNAFTPNGDGFNDNWTIPELRFYNNVYIQVFDRSGVRVFETTDPETGWNGRAANGQLLKGPYLYIVEVKDINWVKRGVVTILSK
ncbi:Ig-like domain-containing protein [Pontibacter oryzae]|uniref:C-type lectin domain-containing protein n=1 Tax=Pontibacter oryzae TaxID=2304593 RepID=A0A399SGJ8_9BACT|nr:Ig-like domain-containing protein [Pontibacter oryzae]RIJ42710.1 hypothetical protein D1627_02360 [Pontibacter oryzae]